MAFSKNDLSSPNSMMRVTFCPQTAHSLFMMVVSLATQKQNPPMAITDVDGKLLDTNPFRFIGLMPIRDALRKLRPEEYDK